MTDLAIRRPATPLRSRLAFRFGVALCLGAAAVLVAAGVWNVRLQQEHMTRLVSDSADRGAQIILSSTRAAMFANEPGDVHRILADVAALPGFERIRIFDKQGRIQKSTEPEEVGGMVDKAAEQCYVCHRADRPLERIEGTDRVRIFRPNGGGRVLSVIAPIRNEAECSTAACHAHPASQQVLGVLDVRMSLDRVDEQLVASEKQMALGMLATVAAMLVIAGFLTWVLVLRPVRRLTRATVAVGEGDLGSRIPVTSSDEIGEMTRAWNAMLGDLDRARDELQQWNRTLEERVDAATRELERAHQRMLLVEKMASLGKLAAVVAHEVNNPLAGIATYAKLLRKKLLRRAGEGGPVGEDAETAKILELVESESQRCGEIVRNLLLFSRTPEDLGPIVERCSALVHHQAELQQVEMRVEIAPELPRVVCDASQVQQVVLALAMNAIEAMPQGGRVTLTAGPDPAGDAVVLRVSDSGCGIQKDDLARIFEPFFTTKPEGKGVGLGLAVVYGIVERHHGRVSVESSPGQGSTFTVCLPLRQPAAPAAALPQPVAPAAAQGETP